MIQIYYFIPAFLIHTHTHHYTKMASNISTPAITPTPTPAPLPPTATVPAAAVNFTIRKATPEDAEQIARLGAAVFTDTFAQSGCTQEQLQAYLDESYSVEAIRADLCSSSKTTLVAVEQQKQQSSSSSSPSTTTATTVLGFTLLNRASSDEEPAITHLEKPVELQRLYVGLDQHGKGIGKALMGEIEVLAREEGWRHMWLGVWEFNFRAQRVYTKLGYEKVGEHVFDVGGDLQTDWILFKEL